MEHEVRRALGGKEKKGGEHQTHTHAVKYTRAANGGMIAHVEKHHGAGPHSEGHSHTEEHSIPDFEGAQGHFDEHMGDQPGFGEMEPQQAPAPAEGTDTASAAGM